MCGFESCLPLDRSQSTWLQASLQVSVRTHIRHFLTFILLYISTSTTSLLHVPELRVCASHCNQRALELYFPPSPPSCLVIYHHKSQIHVSKPQEGHAALIDCHWPGQALTVFTRIKPRFPLKDLRELHLDQRVLDDSAYIQPPFCNVRVVVIQVWWKGEQMRSEIFCREESKFMWDALTFHQLLNAEINPLDSAHMDQNLPPSLEDNSSLFQLSYFYCFGNLFRSYRSNNSYMCIK